MVICLVGYGYCLETNEQTKTKVICEECELSHLKLNENDLNKIKLTKMKQCLVSRKAQIAREEENKKSRVVRSVEEQNKSFADMFKTSKAFKHVLFQYLKLKETISKNVESLQQGINQAVDEFNANDYKDEEEQTKKPEIEQTKPATIKSTPQQQQPKCDNKLVCEKPNYVIKIKEAVLTNKNNDETCNMSDILKLNLQDMDDECYNKEEATKRLSTICNGHTECEVSITEMFSSLCDCTEKKHLEIEYVCEPETEAHSISKRALYYQNDPISINQNDRYRDRIMDYYDRFGMDYYDDYYYNGCDYNGYDYYNYYYDYYNDCNYYYDDYDLFTRNLASKPAKKVAEAAVEQKSEIKKLSGSYNSGSSSSNYPAQQSYGKSYGGVNSPKGAYKYPNKNAKMIKKNNKKSYKNRQGKSNRRSYGKSSRRGSYGGKSSRKNTRSQRGGSYRQ